MDRASKCSRPTKGCWESRLGGVRKGDRTKGLGNVPLMVTCEAERCARQAVRGSEAGMAWAPWHGHKAEGQASTECLF